MQIEPPVATFDPAAAFEVTHGTLKLLPAGDTPIELQGRVSFTWSPSPRLTFSATSSTMTGPIIGPTDMTVPGIELAGRCWLANQRATSTETKFDGFLNEPAHSGIEVPVKELRFALVNFVDTPALVATFKDWTLEVSPVDDLADRLRAATAERGHVATHLCRLTRADGSDFAPTEARTARDVAYWAFSFARAQHVGLELTTGFDGQGASVWRDWRETVSDRASPRLSWFDHRDPAALVEILANFADGWPALGNSIPNALSFYLESSTSSTPETSIVVGCAGVDLLTWLTLVERGPRLSSEAFDKLWQSDRLRLLLHAVRVPNEIPPSLPNLEAHARANNWLDGPHAVTELRNAIVHPKKWMRAGSAPVAASVEAKRLVLWYFDLALLRLCGYRGRYVSHTAPFPSGAIGTLQPVPWSSALG